MKHYFKFFVAGDIAGLKATSLSFEDLIMPFVPFGRGLHYYYYLDLINKSTTH